MEDARGEQRELALLPLRLRRRLFDARDRVEPLTLGDDRLRRRHRRRFGRRGVGCLPALFGARLCEVRGLAEEHLRQTLHELRLPHAVRRFVATNRASRDAGEVGEPLDREPLGASRVTQTP
jgi:hypothetical protein